MMLVTSRAFRTELGIRAVPVGDPGTVTAHFLDTVPGGRKLNHEHQLLIKNSFKREYDNWKWGGKEMGTFAI